jgi:hypothetical protein
LIVASLGVISSRPDFSARQAHIAALSPADRDRLLRNLERFQALDEEQQARLVRLEGELMNDPQADTLLAVLQNYYDWSKHLTAAHRFELRRLEPAQRVQRIEQLYSQEYEQRIRRDDQITLATWLEERILRGLPTEEQKQIAARPPLERRLLVLKHRPRPDQLLEDLRQEEVDQLVAQLHSEFGDKLRHAGSLAEARQILGLELSELPRHMMFDRNLFSDEAMTQNQHVLAEFFEHLDVSERDRLLSLPPDEMRRSLEWEYYRRQFPDEFRDRGRWEFVSPQRGRGGPTRNFGGRERPRRTRPDDEAEGGKNRAPKPSDGAEIWQKPAQPYSKLTRLSRLDGDFVGVRAPRELS